MVWMAVRIGAGVALLFLVAFFAMICWRRSRTNGATTWRAEFSFIGWTSIYVFAIATCVAYGIALLLSLMPLLFGSGEMLWIAAPVAGWVILFGLVFFLERCWFFRRKHGADGLSKTEVLLVCMELTVGGLVLIAGSSLVAHAVALLPFFWFTLVVTFICFSCAISASRRPRTANFAWIVASNWGSVVAFALRYSTLGVPSGDGDVTHEPMDAFILSCRTWFHVYVGNLGTVEGPLLIEVIAQAALSIPVLGFWVVHTTRAMRPKSEQAMEEAYEPSGLRLWVEGILERREFRRFMDKDENDS